MSFLYDAILTQIKSGEIKCISMEPTDTEGRCYEAVYRIPRLYGQEEFAVYLSAYCNESFEEQAADQICDCIQKEKLEREQ